MDDDPAITGLMETALRSNGYECLIFNSTAGFLEKAAKQKPDLIILDIMMPDTDGTEVNIRLKEDPATKNIPVIFLTGLIQKNEEQTDLSCNKDIVFAKPFSMNQLLAKIKEILKS